MANKYDQDFIDKVHALKEKMTKTEIAKKVNTTVRSVRYILDERKPSFSIYNQRVDEAKKEIKGIMKKIKKKIPWLK